MFMIISKIKQITCYAKLLLLIIYMFSLMAAAQQAKAETYSNWLSGWQYRRSIIVQSAETLKDYQLRIVLDTASLIAKGKLRGDCGDLRFTLSDGVTKIPYWIEKGCGTISTIVWLRVPELVQDTSTILYVYYGNPTATSRSNGERVFMFFDDFNYDRKWHTSYAKYSITKYNGHTVMRIVDISHTKNNIAYLPIHIQCNTIIEWRAIQPKYWTYDQFGIALFDNKLIDPKTGRNYNGYLVDVSFDNPGTSAWIAVNHDARHTILARYSGGVDLSHWHTYSFTLSCDGYLEFRSDEGWKISARDSSYKSFDFLGIWLDTESAYHGSERPVYYDWIRVRRYAGTMPATVIGSEENLEDILPKTVTSTITRWMTRTVTLTSTVTRVFTSTITSTHTEERVSTSTVTSTVTVERTVEKPVTSTITVINKGTVTSIVTSTSTVTVAAKPSLVALTLALLAIIIGLASLIWRK